MRKIIVISPAVRIRIPSELTNNKWQVENFDTRKIFCISELGVSILLYCIYQQEQEKIIYEISKFYNYSRSIVYSLIVLMMKNGLIIQQNCKENKLNSIKFSENYSRWAQYHWHGAADYHFFTYDYQFLDYSENGEGWRLADQRMKDYSQREADINRIKKYPAAYKRIFPEISLMAMENLQDHKQLHNTFDFNSLSLIAAFAFAQVAEASIRWRGSALIRKTSPSGGSRHPTEGYVLVLNVHDMVSGLYHIQSSPFCFVELTPKITISLEKVFPALYKNPNKTPAAIFILTSIFERNMFRYREPRTFRTVHMDVGHILGTIELIAEYLEVASGIIHQCDEWEVEKYIGIDGLSEGFMSCIAIFNLGVNHAI